MYFCETENMTEIHVTCAVILRQVSWQGDLSESTLTYVGYIAFERCCYFVLSLSLVIVLEFFFMRLCTCLFYDKRTF